MKIAWIATGVTEAEHDIWLSRRPGLDIVMCSVIPTKKDFFQLVAEEDSTRARLAMFNTLRQLRCDLYIYRFPYWMNDEITEIPQPAVAWASEQGPTRRWILDSSKRLFDHIAYNTRGDEEAYRQAFPDKKLHYLPYGCTHHMRQVPEPLYASDLIADGFCHYGCNGVDCSNPGDNDKHVSVDTLVRPLMQSGLNIKVWGPLEAPHGWMSVPEVAAETDRFYKGVYDAQNYASVYASCKLYIGISWNWRLGGYGTKLARAMASGIPVLWHDTLNMDLDGLEEDEHLAVSSTPSQTLYAVEWLLGHPKQLLDLGRRGRQFAFRNWEWGNNILRLAEEIL